MFLLVLAAMTVPAGAATKVTVAELEQMLTAAHGAPDAKLAEQLSALELTERLSASRFARLKADLPGEKTQQALTVLADAAEFLNLPAAEIPTTAAPDPAVQRHIMSLVVRYATRSVHELPNFFATRETTRFEDRPQGDYGYMPLHFIAKSSKSVVYRDGQEMIDTGSGKSGWSGGELGLVSWGEFGPILSTVLLDAAQSKLAWSHWEQGASGPVAVFGYSVPDPKSHYWVQYCCKQRSISDTPEISREKTGYQGEIAVDPATGAILRMTADAELPLSETLTRAVVMVEYGSIEIGGKSFICPERSVALSLMRYAHSTTGAHSILDHDPIKTYLNDVAFEQYHRLGAESRILSGDGGDLPGNSPAAPPDASMLQPASAALTAPPAPAPTVAPVAPAEVASAPTPAPVSAPQPVPAQVAPQEQILTLKANARAVELDVVVTDKKQEPVIGLGRQLFEVLEDGKPQAVDYFEEHTAKPAPQSDAPKLPANLYTNLPSTPVMDAVNVVLIDKLNTPMADQVQVHQQILDFLAKMKPGTKMAIFVLDSKLRVLQGFTSDAAQLHAVMVDPKNGDVAERNASTRTGDDEGEDQVHIENHLMMLGGTKAKSGGGYNRSDAGGPAAAQAQIASNQAGERVSMTLRALEILARYLAGIEGRKNLIWFSSSFPVSGMIFFNQQGKERLPGIQSLDPAAKETSNLLTLSKIAVYPVSAEGLQVYGALSADAYNDPTLNTLSHGSEMKAMKAQEASNLANETGGKAFYNTNDLAGALTHAIDDGAHYYTLAYTPANKKMDGAFRSIQVRLTQGSYDLAYRRGYYADDHAAPEPNLDSDPLHPLLVRGAPASTQIVFSARLLAAAQQPAPGDKPAGGNTRLAGPLTRYRVDFNLRPSDIELIDAAGGRHTGKIQVELLAYDRNGAALNWAGGTMALNLSAETFESVQRTGIPAHLEIDLPSAALYLEAGVYDWTARKAGTIEIPLHLAAAEQSK